MAEPLSIVLDEGVAIVEMRSADGKNALGVELVQALAAALATLSLEVSVRVLVLLGTPTVFCSGAPRELLNQFAQGDVAPTDVALGAALLDFPLPCIAAMAGHATGGGFALGLCADI